jgi:cysteine desulfurase
MKFPIYLDNHATTPVDPQVFAAMAPYFSEKFGNASSISHSFGWEAEKSVKSARKKIASLTGADEKEIYFTSGATESINLIHFGIARAYESKGNQIISAATEHSAVIDTLNYLKQKGFTITYLPVDDAGNISLEQLINAVSEKTILVSLMSANNEIGTIHNIREIGKICRKKNILFHTDAAQAVGKIKINFTEMNVDLASFTAHKFYGPKGIGAAFIKNKSPKIKLVPQFYGGGQENGIRPGTLNVPAIVGFGKAAEIADENLEEESLRISGLRDHLQSEILKNLNGVKVNGAVNSRLPNNLNLSFEGIKSETLMMEMREIALSTGSACSSGTLKPGRVLKAIGLSDESAKASIRIGLSRFTTIDEINYTIEKIIATVKKLRKESPAYNEK